jgi:hypothetical protein
MNPILVEQPAPPPTEQHLAAPDDIRGFSGIYAALQEHVPLLALLALYLVARLAWTGGGWPLDWSVVMLLGWVFALLTVLCIPLLVLGYAFVVTHRRPGTYAAFRWRTWVHFRREYLGARRLTSVLIAWAFLSVYIALFGHWKADIGTSVAFTWDERFMQWDRALHFGRHPWEWLHPLVAHPGVTRVIDTLYHQVWTFAKPGLFLLMAWSSDRVLASRFLVSYALLWIILGTMLAYAFASAGPVFYAGVVSSTTNPYEELTAYLSMVDARYGLISVAGSAMLWNGFVSLDWPRVGISAMPSLHVALAALVAILGFSIHRVWGVLATLYLLIVLVGSVHLAWHYAIDGYLSILLVGPVWWASGQWVGTCQVGVTPRRIDPW